MEAMDIFFKKGVLWFLTVYECVFINFLDPICVVHAVQWNSHCDVTSQAMPLVTQKTMMDSLYKY